jgi:outer membrane protein assembly factor BamB
VNKGADDFASGVATDGHHRLFVSGAVYQAGNDYDWLLRAYDTRTHELLWEDTFDLNGRTDVPRGTALAVGAGLVFLGGFASNQDDVGVEWIVRAYDAATGELVWQDRIPGFSAAYALAYENGRVFAGGSRAIAPTARDDMLVRAYDARTGAVLWSHRTPGASAFPVGNKLTKIVAQDDRVYAAQSIRLQDFTSVPRLKAFDAASGVLLWENVVDQPGEDWIQDLAISGGHVVAVGYGGSQCRPMSGDSDCDAIVRSYHAASGALRWERQIDLSGVDDHGELVAADGGIVYVGSSAGPLHSFPSCCVVGQWVVSALDLSEGRLLWQTVEEVGDSGVYNMVLHRGRLIVPGRSVEFQPFEWDLIVRAYDARGRNGAVAFPTPHLITASGVSGTRSYSVNFETPVMAAAHGLVPPERQPGAVVDDPANDIEVALQTGIGVTSHTVSVPPGARTSRVSLFDDETDGDHDLDLYVFGPNGNFVGRSVGTTATESVTLVTPPPGNYRVVVHGLETAGPVAAYTLFAWALGSGATGNLTVSGPVPQPHGSARVTIDWFGLDAGTRYLGAISYSDGTGEVGETLVAIRADP